MKSPDKRGGAYPVKRRKVGKWRRSEATGVQSIASRPAFLYMGAMTPKYDLVTVVHAAARLKEAGLDFELWFAGSAVSEPNLKERINGSGLGNRVSFFGFLHQEELRAKLAAADVGLNAIMPAGTNNRKGHTQPPCILFVDL